MRTRIIMGTHPTSGRLWIGFFICLLQWKSRNTLVKVARMIELGIRDALVKCNSCDGTGVCPECLGTGDGPPDATNWLGNRTKPEHFCSCSVWINISGGFATTSPDRSSFGRCNECNGTGSISREVFEKEQQEEQDRLQRGQQQRERERKKEEKKMKKLEMLLLHDLVLAVSIIESIDYFVVGAPYQTPISEHRVDAGTTIPTGGMQKVYSIVSQIANRCVPKVKNSSALTSSSNGEKLFTGTLGNGRLLRLTHKEIRVTVFSDGIQYKPDFSGGKLDWISSHQLRELPTMEWSESSFLHGVYREIVIGNNRIPFFPGLCAFFVCLRHYYCLLESGCYHGNVDNHLRQQIVELQNRLCQ